MSLSGADREQIRDLVARYASYADARRLPELAALFCADAELVLPDPPNCLAPTELVTGRNEILAAMQSLATLPITLHSVLNIVVDEVDERGCAIGDVAGAAHHVTDRKSGEVSDLVWYLRYRDSYRLDDGVWRFARRALRIEWIETRAVRQRRNTATPEVM